MRLIIEAVRDNLRYLSELPELTEVFLPRDISDEIGADPELQQMVSMESSRQVFDALVQKFSGEETLTKKRFLDIMKDVQNETGVRGKNLWMPTRVALTGEAHGPALPAVVEILGLETCLNRLRAQLAG